MQLQEAQLQKRIKVWEAIDLWASLYSRPVDGTRLLEQLGLVEKRDAWFMTLSGGQKQRLFIALALINDPELVFLDELTTGLDPQARRAIWDLVRGIRQRGKTVFMTTHLMEEAERLCDRVAVIDRGKIIDIDTPAALVRRHCPERTVIVTTSQQSAEALFRQLAGVTSVERREADVVIHGSGDELVSHVIQCLAQHAIPVIDFRTELPTLEDVFLRLTGHSDSVMRGWRWCDERASERSEASHASVMKGGDGVVNGASERSERATRSERADEAARESACRGVRGAKPLGE